MELRLLDYFLVISREGTISDAAQQLHITQPTLSRQMRDLEAELGKQLFIRSNKKITLTQEGILFRQRAEEIMNLVDKTKAEIISINSPISGEIYIGSGESHALKIITRTIKKMEELYPLVKFHIHSGNAPDTIEKLDNGLIDFGLITQHSRLSEFNHLLLPIIHNWGVLMCKDDELAKKKFITYEDIKDKPLIVSKEINQLTDLVEWLKNDIENLNIVSTYSLLYNASLMVEDNLGYAICFDQLINTTGDSQLVFKPLYPNLECPYYFIWKKYPVLTNASRIFLEIVQETIEEMIEI